MATYTYDITTPVGQVRFLGQDVVNVAGTAFFSDEELTFLLTQQAGNINSTAIQALRTKARNYASRSEKQIGDATYDYISASKQLFAAADALELEGASADDDGSLPAVGEAGGSVEGWW